jgi:hypothetical protein
MESQSDAPSDIKALGAFLLVARAFELKLGWIMEIAFGSALSFTPVKSALNLGVRGEMKPQRTDFG